MAASGGNIVNQVDDVYNGLLGMYLPLAIFFVWVEGVTWTMTTKLKGELADLTRGAPNRAASGDLADARV